MQEEDGLIRVKFIRTKENVADIGTKNVDTNTYRYHEGRLLMDKQETDEEEEHVGIAFC